MPEALPDLDILLATWNGAAWLPVQLESILSQGGPRTRILVRDDGSRDGTRELLAAWAERHPGRIVILRDNGRRLGACGNFAALLHASTARWVMFCDQDDRWHSGKIAATCAVLGDLEAKYGSDRPLLVHGDADLVDCDLHPLGRSLSQALQVRLEDAGDLHRQLIQNSATGCTMMLNQALVRAALPVPVEAIMHDWWVALVAAAIGTVATVPGQLLDYRQHQANVFGAGGLRLSRLAARFTAPGAVRKRFVRAAAQAEILLARHGSVMTASQVSLCRAFADLPQRGWLGRRATVMRYGFWMSGVRRNIGMMALL